MSTSKRVGDLGSSGRWMTAHAHELKDVVPLPGCTWSFSETDLTRSQFSYLRRKNLIVKIGEQEWRSTRKLIKGIADYGRFNEEDVGVDLQCDRPGCVACADRRARESRDSPWTPTEWGETEQANLATFIEEQ